MTTNTIKSTASVSLVTFRPYWPSGIVNLADATPSAIALAAADAHSDAITFTDIDARIVKSTATGLGLDIRDEFEWNGRTYLSVMLDNDSVPTTVFVASVIDASL